MYIVITNGSLESLKYFWNKKLPYTIHGTSLAAGFGHLNCLQFLHETGEELDSYTVATALKRKDKRCLQYLYDNLEDNESRDKIKEALDTLSH